LYTFCLVNKFVKSVFSMRFSSSRQLLAAFLASTVFAAPTIYLAGDSTMVATGNNDGTNGWGLFLNNSTTLAVVNDAIAGRSARSFTVEGRFAAMAQVVKAGDFVIIEFGHNDGGSLTPTDNGRTDCPVPANGNFGATCVTTFNGSTQTILTYPAYLENAAQTFISLGASVILSSPTPDNPWETGTFTYTANRFTTYSQQAAAAVGATFVDHGTTTANAFQALGASAVDAFFPHDHTHTSPAGAMVVEQAFITGLKTTNSTLKNFLK